MKKFFILALAISFILTGCTSTDPALTTVMSENLKLANGSFEGTQTINIHTNILDVLEMNEEVPTEVVQLLEILEDGLTFEVKQQDIFNQYAKVSFNNSDRVKELPFWTVDAEPYMEFLGQDNNTYFKTSSEDKWILLDDGVEADIAPRSLVEQLQPFLTEAMQDYLKQFNFQLDHVKDLGKTTVSTPEGDQQLHHIQVSLDFEDARDLLVYFLGNLAEYEKVDQLIKEYFDIIFSDPELLLEDEEFAELIEEDEEFAQFVTEYEMNEEELDEFVTEFREVLNFFKELVEEVDEESIAMSLGYTPSMDILIDFYLNNDAQIIKQDMEMDVALTPVEMADGVSEETIKFQIASESLIWNIGGDIELPNVTEAYDFDSILYDPDALAEMNEGSVVKNFLEGFATVSRYGILTVGDDEALINDMVVELENAPFVENGTTMVPFRVVADIAQSEVDWNAETQSLTFEVDGITVVAQIGSKIATVNGEQIELPTAPVLKDRAYIRTYPVD